MLREEDFINTRIQLPAACYNALSDADIQEIIHGLTINHELPLKFSYMGNGATRWQSAVNEMSPEKQKSMLPDLTSMLEPLQRHIGHQATSVIDLGPGNGLQAKELLNFLLSKKQLQSYVGVDISPQMLDIAADNMRGWTNGQVQMIKHVKDFYKEPLDNVFQDKQLDDTPRIILMLGGTLDNETSPINELRKITQYMWPGDVLLYDIRTPVDSPSSRQSFDLSPRHSFLLELLDIPKRLYEAERSYDADTHTRLDQIIPLHDISLTYIIDGEPITTVLTKGEPITVWRYHAQTLSEASQNLQQSGLTITAISESEGQRKVVFMCQRPHM